MPIAQKKDLFDDSTMSFGEHLEELRVRLWKGLLGLVLGVIAMLFVGDKLIAVIRKPIDDALQSRGITKYKDEEGDTKLEDRNWKDYFREFFGSKTEAQQVVDEQKQKALGHTDREKHEGVVVRLNARELAEGLHATFPETYNAPPAPPANKAEPAAVAEKTEAKTAEAEETQDKTAESEETQAEDEPKIQLTLWAEEFAQFKKARELSMQPITLTVQEAFVTYVKVSIIGGLVISAPWLLYQIWMFVAAGLYPHEKKYVYVFLPISMFLFIAGAVFCFFVVFPVMLYYLLSFNEWLNTVPQIRLSEWIGFAIILPVMFGVSFQLPLVMLFLERISVFDVKTYRSQRRIAILAIAVASMILTPSPDPGSMIAMMIPLCLLYELGILMCRFMEEKKPFEPETV